MGYSENADRFAVDELGFIQTALSSVLAAAARGEVDLNRLAMEELANRGQDDRGNWIGFEPARRHFADRLARREPAAVGAATITVQVLIYEYPNGTNVSVFADEASARAELAGIARDGWHDRADRSAPAEHGPLDDETVIAHYFEGHEREFYRLEAVPVTLPLPGWPGVPAHHPGPWTVMEMLEGSHGLEDAQGWVVGLVRDIEVAHWIVAVRNGLT